MSNVCIMVKNLMKGGTSEREKGYDPYGDEKKRQLRNGGDLCLGTRGIWKLWER